MHSKITSFVVVACAVALAGALAGCGSQQPASSSASSAASSSAASSSAATSSTASAASSSSAATADTAAVLDELAKLMEKAPGDYKSMTVAQENAFLANTATDPATTKSTYKYDLSGAEPKVYTESNIDGSIMKVYVDGAATVVDMGDGNVYGGTTEQFAATATSTPLGLLETVVGKYESLSASAKQAIYNELDGRNQYALDIDPAKYAEESAEFAELNKALMVSDMAVDYIFDKEGQLLEAGITFKGANESIANRLVFSGFDATTVEPAPEANKTYEDMTADIQAAVTEAMSSSSAAEASSSSSSSN